MKSISLKNIQPGGAIEFKKYHTVGNFTSWRTRKPIHIQRRCIDCGQCWYICPDRAVIYQQGKFVKVDYKFCKGCGLCAKICPVKAIVMEKE